MECKLKKNMTGSDSPLLLNLYNQLELCKVGAKHCHRFEGVGHSGLVQSSHALDTDVNLYIRCTVARKSSSHRFGAAYKVLLA